jgi:hypothetical protein
VRFVDFDFMVVGPGEVEQREVNSRFRGFVEAVAAALEIRKSEAPWRKLVVEVVPAGGPTAFMPALPDVGLSVAVVQTSATDPTLLTASGSAVRPVMADTISRTRHIIRNRIGWDDHWFWTLIGRTGMHEGAYEQRLPETRDRKRGVRYHLTRAWDETGTTLYADARAPADDQLLGRTLIREFPRQWEWFDAQVPSKIRLSSGGLELVDLEGHVVTTIDPPA